MPLQACGVPLPLRPARRGQGGDRPGDPQSLPADRARAPSGQARSVRDGGRGAGLSSHAVASSSACVDVAIDQEDAATSLFIQLAQAYEILSDPIKRRQVDDVTQCLLQCPAVLASWLVTVDMEVHFKHCFSLSHLFSRRTQLLHLPCSSMTSRATGTGSRAAVFGPGQA